MNAYIPFNIGKKTIIFLSNDVLIKLNQRDIGILISLLSGNSVTEIASKLKKSVKTISSHKRNIYNKLGVNNDLTLFRELMHYGYIKI